MEPTICCRLFFPFKIFLLHSLRCLLVLNSFVFWNVHHRAFPSEPQSADAYTYAHTQLSYHRAIPMLASAQEEANRPCADYGAISVYHLLSSVDEIFIQISAHSLFFFLLRPSRCDAL